MSGTSGDEVRDMSKGFSINIAALLDPSSDPEKIPASKGLCFGSENSMKDNKREAMKDQDDSALLLPATMNNLSTGDGSILGGTPLQLCQCSNVDTADRNTGLTNTPEPAVEQPDTRKGSGDDNQAESQRLQNVNNGRKFHSNTKTGLDGVYEIVPIIPKTKKAEGNESYIDENLTCNDSGGMTPLHSAASSNKALDIVMILMNAMKNAEENESYIDENVTCNDSEYMAQLELAASSDNVLDPKILQFLPILCLNVLYDDVTKHVKGRIYAAHLMKPKQQINVISQLISGLHKFYCINVNFDNFSIDKLLSGTMARLYKEARVTVRKARNSGNKDGYSLLSTRNPKLFKDEKFSSTVSKSVQLDRKRIGKGGNGEVVEGFHDNKLLAIKQTTLKEVELSVVPTLKHKNLLPWFALVRGQPSTSRPGQLTCYQIFDRMTEDLGASIKSLGGSIHDNMVQVKKSGFSRTELSGRAALLRSSAAMVFRETLQGLEYLHSRLIVHRDIKASNILVKRPSSCTNSAHNIFLCDCTSGGQWEVRIADFDSIGHSDVLRSQSADRSRRTGVQRAYIKTGSSGTRGYGAPENSQPTLSSDIHDKDFFNPAADIWSFGCVGLHVAMGYCGPHSQQQFAKLLLASRGVLSEEDRLKMVNKTLCLHHIQQGFPGDKWKELVHFVSQPLKVDPKNRPSAAALLEHPYLNQQGSTLLSAGSGGAEVPPPQSISVQSTQQLSPLTTEHSHARPRLDTGDVHMKDKIEPPPPEGKVIFINPPPPGKFSYGGQSKSSSSEQGCNQTCKLLQLAHQSNSHNVAPVASQTDKEKKNSTSLGIPHNRIQIGSYTDNRLHDYQLTGGDNQTTITRSRRPSPQPQSNHSVHSSTHSSSASGSASAEISATSFYQNCKLFNSTNASSLDHTHLSVYSASAAAVAGGASTEFSATSFHQNCKLFNSTNASSLDHTHLSVYSASAAGDCLHFTETFTNNLSEDVTSRLPVKEEEEKGSVEVFTNSLADLQSSVFGRSDLYTDPAPVLHSPSDECCTVIMATNKYSRSLLPIGSRVSCPSRVSSVWSEAGATRGLTVVYGGEEFTAVQSSAPRPHLETWSSLHHNNIQELSAVLGDCPLHRETTYLLTPKRPSECVRSLMEIMLSTSSIISRLSSSANNKEKELILKNMQSVLLEVLSGLSFLHSQGLVHRQLRMRNILLDMRCGCGDVFLCPHEDRDSYRVYLADLSKVASEEEGGLSQQDDVTLFGWMLEELMFGLDAAVEFQVVERECPELKGLYKVYLSCVQTSSDEVATVQKLVQDLGHLDTTIPPPSPTGNVGTTILSSTSTKDDVQTTISSPSSTEDDEQTTISSPSSTKDDVQTTISSPRSTRDDVQTTILSPSSTKDNVQTTTSSPRSTGGVVLIPPPPPLKGGGVYSGQQETAQENGKEFNAKMIVGHFSSLPKNAVVPTGGDKPFYFGQSVLGFFSVAVPPVPAHEGSEGSSNMIAVVSDKKMDQKEIARGRSTLERDEYLALLYEQRKDDTMEPPPPEGKIIFSTCAEFTEGSVLPLPSAAAMADGIGKGGNGVVSYVYHMGKEFAVKETCLREEEMRTLSKLSGQASRNVLPISAVMEGPPLDRYHGRRACYQLMPRATGDVRQMLDRSGSPTLCHYFFKYKPEPAKSFCVLANTRVVLRQALRGLQHLHSKGIVHRDVKLQNILLDMRCGCGDVFLCPHEGSDSYRVYLADFDSALDVERARGKLEERARKGSVLRFTPYGTQGYRAPETSFFHCSNQVLSPEPLSLATRMVLGSAITPYLNPAQDLWSFGCTVLKLFVGVTGPTSQKEVASVLLADCLRRSTQSSSRYQHSVHGRLTVDDEEMKKLLKVSSVKKCFPLAVELQGLIRQCLQVDPDRRPSAEQCAQHQFLRTDPATIGPQSPSLKPFQEVQMYKFSTMWGRPQDPNTHSSLRGVKRKQLRNDDKRGLKALVPRVNSMNSPKSSNGGNTGPPSSTPPVPIATYLVDKPRDVSGASDTL